MLRCMLSALAACARAFSHVHMAMEISFPVVCLPAEPLTPFLAAPAPVAVLQVLDEVGDDAAIYSPLGRGASALSEQGLLAGPWDGASTPRSIASSPGPLVSDGGATPRSPW